MNSPIKGPCEPAEFRVLSPQTKMAKKLFGFHYGGVQIDKDLFVYKFNVGILRSMKLSKVGFYDIFRRKLRDIYRSYLLSNPRDPVVCGVKLEWMGFGHQVW